GRGHGAERLWAPQEVPTEASPVDRPHRQAALSPACVRARARGGTTPRLAVPSPTMRHPNLPIEGACRCGHVRIKLTARPLCTAACHCTGCQKMSSSAFSLSAIVPETAFEIIEGEPVPGGRDPAVGH